MRGKFNLFQRAMLRWRELYPYSAVHAIRLQAPFDREQLACVIERTLTELGLTGFVLDAHHKRFEYRGGAATVSLAVIETNDADHEVDCEIERQLNARFPDAGPYLPFRFFAIPAGNAFYLGIAYDHIVAGGDCIAVLLSTLTARYQGDTTAAIAPTLYPPTYQRLFRRNVGRMLRALHRLPNLVHSCRHSVRPLFADAQDGRNEFVRYTLDGVQYRAVRDAAHRWGVTLNDALLALLLHALDSMTQERRKARRRREIGVASIMNLRAEFGMDARQVFGQFLGPMRLSHPVPEGVDVAQLAREVNVQTSRIKREKLFLQNLIALPVNALLWRFQTRAQRCAFYAKGYPVSAGVTTLNIDALWQPGENREAPVYVRGVSTGPLAPVVVAVTTSGPRLEAGLSYRTTALTRNDVARLWSGVLDGLRTLQ